MDSQSSNDVNCAKVEESPPEKVLSSGIQLRASARVSKKLRLDQELALVQAQSPEKKPENINSNGLVTEEKRRRQAPVLWSPDDKAAFFEALNEHGKNFDAIEKYMLSRAKRRGDGAAKNREKARYFYYRTLHKLSRHVQFPADVKKVTQELYALINYGELRKKVGHITEKNSQKLNELIYTGRTQVRVSGKTWRVKTPICRALRRLNNLDEDCEEVRLPQRVEVLLTPRTNKDSTRARVTGHNPRVKAVLSLHTNVSSLVSFLTTRWATPAQRGELRIGPRSDSTITLPQYKCGQAVTAASVSLLSHVQRFGGDVAQVQSLIDQLPTSKTRGTIKKDKESAAAIEDIANTEFVDPLATDSTVNVPSTEQSQMIVEEKEVDKEELFARIKDGWNEEIGSKTRIGQLYLMIGSKGVIEMEYWWIEEESSNTELSKALQRLVSLARTYHFKFKVECPCGHKCKNIGKLGANDTGKGLKRPPNATSKKQQHVTAPVADIQVPSASGVTPKVEIMNRVTENCGQGNQLISGTFKHPLLPAPVKQQNSTLNTLKQLQAFRPKYCNRRGRFKSRSLIVQRMLPLLPKSQSQPVVVALNVLAPNSGPQLPPQLVGELNGNGGGRVIHLENTPPGGGAVTSAEPSAPIDGQGLLPQRDEAGTSIIDTSTLKTEDPLATNTFRGILGCGNEAEVAEDTPPTSPTRILKEEGQWLSSEVSDFSLSSFLGHLESPLKSNGATSSDDIQISNDVESHFQSLMTESSLDYTAKFADLAEKIAGGAEPHAC